MPKINIDARNDPMVDIARMQQYIIGYLGLKTGDLLFEFNVISGNIKLDLITINPRHNQSFLFHTTIGLDKIDALKKMVEYVELHKEKENSYTIQWTAQEDNELHTSYFRATNIMDALEKLYYGRDRATLTVFSVVLNPVS